MIRAWGFLFFWGLLRLTWGHEGQGAFLRIRKKYLEEELGRCLVSSDMGEELTHLVGELSPQPPPDSGKPFFGHIPYLPPRITVETPYHPAIDITMRSEDSVNLHWIVVFGVYLEYSFDPLGKEVEIQVTKDFSTVMTLNSSGFQMKSCRSCGGWSDIKTWYKSSSTSIEGVTPMVQIALGERLIPVLDEKSCGLLQSALSRPGGCLLSQTLFDLSPLGIQYFLESFLLRNDTLILELRVSEEEGKPDGRAEEADGGAKERLDSLLDSLPKMHKEAVTDIAMAMKQLDWNFAQLLQPIKPIILDKNHKMGFCMLESVQPLLPGQVSDEELENYVMNLTAHEPPRFYSDFGILYVIHLLKLETFNAEGISVWRLDETYYAPADTLIADNKLKVSLSLESGFLQTHMRGDLSNVVGMLETLLEFEDPVALLDNLEQEFLLPLAPGVGDVVRMKTSCTKEYLLISLIPK
ncbi:uncharacterized protein LOC114599858 [Podarcis muralis]